MFYKFGKEIILTSKGSIYHLLLFIFISIFIHTGNVESSDIKAIKSLAERGDSEAQFQLGLIYATGEKVKKDYEKAFKWYLRAAENNHTEAQARVGWMYFALEYRGAVPQDYFESMKWMLKAANNGHEISRHNIVRMLNLPSSEQINALQDIGTGEGAKKLIKTGKRCWQILKSSAEEGHPFSQFLVGNTYEFGNYHAIEQNFLQAFYWYEKAALNGLPDAQDYLANMYYHGKGTSKNYIKAAEWWTEAALSGKEDAQLTLSKLYYFGHGVLEDPIESFAWATIAATSGAETATTWRDQLKTTLSSNEINRARDTAEELFRKINSSSQEKIISETNEPKRSGTGFFVTKNGFLITCHHVIENAEKVMVRHKDKNYKAKIIREDRHNDLALLKIEGTFPALSFSNKRTTALGQKVFTIGFPNPSIQGISAKLTKGEVSSISGYQDDPRLYQISVPVQPGNSGGALVNEKGEIVGVVVSSLDVETAFKYTGTIPQNVNYCVKGTYALALIDSVPDILNQLESVINPLIDNPENIVNHVENSSVLVLTF